jgi:hypothetical protein
MSSARVWLGRSVLASSIFCASACDIVVRNGETIVADGGPVRAFLTSNAASVHPGGTLVVQNANLTGRDRTFEQASIDPAPPGAAIVADGATVQVMPGALVQAGKVMVTPRDPNSTAPVPPDVPYRLAPALLATSSSIAITGGSFSSSEQLGGSPGILVDSPSIAVSDSSLTIRGGQFMLGASPTRQAGRLPVTPSVLAVRSRVGISGGDFSAGTVQIFSSQTVITGGTFGRGLSLGLRPPPLGFTPIPVGPLNFPLTPLLAAPGCTEIRGGSFAFVGVVEAGERVFIYGTDFNLPFGPVTPPPGQPSTPGGPAFLGAPPTPIPLSGILLDGSATTLQLLLRPGAQVVLARPPLAGGPGCTPGL